MVRLTRYPLNSDGTPMDMLVGVVTDDTGNGGTRAPKIEAPDGSPIEAVGLYLVGAAPGGDTTVRTPYDYGAVGANIVSNPAAVVTDQPTLDASTDDSDALQAFFDDMWSTDAARYIWDWSGHWAVSKPLFFARPLLNVGDLNVEYHGREVICGKLHVLPVAQQPGGVLMDTVLTISGPHALWHGDIFIHDGNRGQTAWANRRFKNGVKLFQDAQAYVESITVWSARRSAVIADGNFGTWSVRVGTPYEAGSTSKNNIGMSIGRIFAVGCGSYHGAAGMGQSFAITSFDQGGWNGSAFDTTEASYFNSALQRTELTVAATSTLEVGDLGKVRTEIFPATYTTIAADNASSKFTWTGGDPVAAGLLVGQRFLVTGGANNGRWFEIVSFGGTSNRDITVRPAPTTEGINVTTSILTEWSVHRITNITSSTKFLVFPQLPNGTNSLWYSISGYALETLGIDTASLNVDFLGGRSTSGWLRSVSLYGPHIKELLADHGEVGVVMGEDYSGGSIGVTVLARHIEGVNFPVLQFGATGTFYIGDGSGLTDFTGCFLIAARTFPTTGRTQQSLLGGRMRMQGRDWEFDNLDVAAASSTMVFGDVQRYLRFTNAAPSYTVPHSVSLDLPAGSKVDLEAVGGTLTVVAAPGVTINSRGGDLTIPQNGRARLKKATGNTWNLDGSL